MGSMFSRWMGEFMQKGYSVLITHRCKGGKKNCCLYPRCKTYYLLRCLLQHYFQQECESSLVKTPVPLSNTHNQCLVFWLRHEAVGPVCCVLHVKETSALIEKRRGLPRCSWFDWQHIAQKHLTWW